jgi:hypothetical protein
MIRAKNKYKNKWTRCFLGHNHQSIAEANYCNQLRYLRLAGEIQSYKTQVTYKLKVNNLLICSHRIDFEVINKNGIKEVHDVKGYETKDFKIKYKLFKALYPEIEYKIIK